MGVPKTLSVLIDDEVQERLRDAVVELRTTVSATVEEAIRRELARLERRHGAFPAREGPVPRGRRPA